MKRTLAIVFLVFTGLLSAVAQDIITLKSGQELKARIIRLNTKDVTFMATGGSDTISLQRDEVSKLYYRSGIIIYLSETGLPEFSNVSPNDSLYSLGEKDATRYYKGYKGAATGTLVSSIFIPLGLIPAIACSATPPAMNNLGYRDQKLMQNSSYYKGYTDQAFTIKKKKVWQNFAIGTGITAGYYIIMIVLVSALMGL